MATAAIPTPLTACAGNSSSSWHGTMGIMNCTNSSMNNYTKPMQDFCNVEISTFYRYYQMFLILVFIWALVGNLTVVVVILSSRVLRSSVTNLFIVSLAISDIGVTLFSLPVKMDYAGHNQVFCRALGVCIFWNLTDVFFNIASVTNLLVITGDRFLAVTSPFSYPSHVTRKRASFMVAFLWIYSAQWTAASLLKWGKNTGFNIKIVRTPRPVCVNHNPVFFTAVYSAVFIVPLVVMGVMYFVILKAAIKQARAITSLEVGNERQKNKRLMKYRREIKATKTIAIVYGAFLFCWLPVCIVTISSNWCKTCYMDFRQSHPNLHKFVYITFVEVLPPLNSTLNPFIYVIFGKQFRAGFKLLLYRLVGKMRMETGFLDGTSYWRDRLSTVDREGQMSLKERKKSSVCDA